MDSCLITFRSVTPAQRGENLLQQEGIRCRLGRTPRVLAEQGCGYSLYLDCAQLHRGVERLRQKGIPWQKAYRMGEQGPQEVWL